jgi:hypothetical protein
MIQIKKFLPNEIYFKILIEFQERPFLYLNKEFYNYYKSNILFKIKNNLIEKDSSKISVSNIIHFLNYKDLKHNLIFFKKKDRNKIFLKMVETGYLEKFCNEQILDEKIFEKLIQKKIFFTDIIEKIFYLVELDSGFNLKNFCLEIKNEKIVFEKIFVKFLKERENYFIFFPKQNLNEEICLRAICKDPNNFKLISFDKNLVTEKIIIESINRNIELVDNIQKEMFNLNISNEIVSKDNEFIKFIPKEILNEEICFNSFKKNYSSLKFIPKNLKEKILNKKIIKKIIKNDNQNIQFIPNSFLNHDFIFKIVNSNEKIAQYLKPDFFDEEICMLQKDPKEMEWIPDKFLNENNCKLALKQNDLCLKFIPVRILKTLKKHNFSIDKKIIEKKENKKVDNEKLKKIKKIKKNKKNKKNQSGDGNTTISSTVNNTGNSRYDYF